MSKKYVDAFGDRMKAYEGVTDNCLVKRMPVIIRLDGCSFHTFTRGFDKPFDIVMLKSMQETVQALCKSIQGCVFGYTQSDEITLILCDYQTLTTSCWFEYRIEKVCSVAASIATLNFNRAFYNNANNWIKEQLEYIEKNKEKVSKEEIDKIEKLISVYNRAIDKCAVFDARCFNVPKEDVCNNVLWRQKDAEKNSVLSLAQSMYSQSEMKGISTKALQDKMFTEKGVNWNDLPIYLKRGSACIKTVNEKGRSVWVIDKNMPILSQDREYVENLITFE